MVRALSAGKLPSLREGTQISGIWTLLLAEDEGPKQGLSQKLCQLSLSQGLCSFCSLHSHLRRLVSERSRTRDGSPRCSGKALPGGSDPSPLAGKVPGCLEPKMGSAWEALWLLPDPDAVDLCSPHLHPRRADSVEQLTFLKFIFVSPSL